MVCENQTMDYSCESVCVQKVKIKQIKKIYPKRPKDSVSNLFQSNCEITLRYLIKLVKKLNIIAVVVVGDKCNGFVFNVECLLCFYFL